MKIKKDRPDDPPFESLENQVNLKLTSFDTPAQELLDPFVWTRFVTDMDRFAFNSVAMSDARAQQVVELLRFEHLSGDEALSVRSLISEAADIFYLPGEELGATDVLVHRIPTTDEFPVNCRQYRFPEIHKHKINKQVQAQLEGGIIRKSFSPYNSPIWIVSKKRTGIKSGD